MNVEIDYLKNRPEYFDEVVRLCADEWGYLSPEKELSDYRDLFSARMQDDRIPLTLVACDGAGLLGTASLKEYDMETRKELSPWLAALYVIEKYRGRGIGRQLVHRVQEIAERMGAKELFLFTPNAERFYLKLGWETVLREKYRGVMVTVMSKKMNCCASR